MDSNSLQKILLMAYIIDNTSYLILWSHTKEEHEPSSFPAIFFEWFEGFRAWHVSELSWIVGKT